MPLIKKIWGTRQRLLKTQQTEIDLLYLDKNTACSIHKHDSKINRFVLLSGEVRVKTDLGTKKLIVNESFDVEPPYVHQFIVDEDSVMIELAFVKEGQIDDKDIHRQMQGGRFIDGKFYTLEQLKENNWLEYKNEK